MQFGFEIKGAEITQNETIVWGNRDLVRIDGQGEVEEVKFNKEIADPSYSVSLILSFLVSTQLLDTNFKTNFWIET